MKLLAKLFNRYMTGFYIALSSTSALAASNSGWSTSTWVGAAAFTAVIVGAIAVVASNESDDDNQQIIS